MLDLLPPYILSIGISLLTLWGIAFARSRTTARLHVERRFHVLCFRFVACSAVAGALGYIAFSGNEIQYRWVYILTAVLLAIAALRTTATDFREHGLFICGVFLPWSWVRKIDWRQRRRTPVMQISTDWGLKLSVPISKENEHAVDRLVRSAARYERVPLRLWLSTWLAQLCTAVAIGGAALGLLMFAGVL